MSEFCNSIFFYSTKNGEPRKFAYEIVNFNRGKWRKFTVIVQKVKGNKTAKALSDIFFYISYN